MIITELYKKMDDVETSKPQAKLWAENLAKEKNLSFAGWTLDPTKNEPILISDVLESGTTTVYPIIGASGSEPEPVDPIDPDKPNPVDPDPIDPPTPGIPENPDEVADVEIAKTAKNITNEAANTVQGTKKVNHSVGDVIHYEIYLKNNNLESWDNVVVNDLLSPNVELISSSVKNQATNADGSSRFDVSVPDANISYIQNSGKLAIKLNDIDGNLDTITQGQTRCVSYNVRIVRSDLPNSDESVSPVTNQASVVGDGLLPTESTSTRYPFPVAAQTSKVYLPGFGATKWKDSSLGVILDVKNASNTETITDGDVLTYTAIISNTAQYSASKNVVFYDKLPFGLTFEKGSVRIINENGDVVETLSDSQVYDDENRLIAFNLGTLLSNKNFRIEFKAQVAQGASTQVESIENTAKAFDAGYLPNKEPSGKYPGKNEAIVAGSIASQYSKWNKDEYGMTADLPESGVVSATATGPTKPRTWQVSTKLLGDTEGTCSISNTETVDEYTNHTVTIKLGDAYAIDTVTVDDQVLGSEERDNFVANGYTFYTITQNHNVVVQVKRLPSLGTLTSIGQYNISVNKYGGDDVDDIGNYASVSKSATVDAGSRYTATWTQNLEYTVTKVLVDGIAVDPYNGGGTDGGSYLFYNINQNHTVDVYFKKNLGEDDPYSEEGKRRVNVSLNNASGTNLITGNALVKSATDYRIEWSLATSEAGKVVDATKPGQTTSYLKQSVKSLVVDGKQVQLDPGATSYTIYGITQDTNVEVNVVQNQYNIDNYVFGDGTISGSSTLYESQTLTNITMAANAAPSGADYKNVLARISLDGVDIWRNTALKDANGMAVEDAGELQDQSGSWIT